MLLVLKVLLILVGTLIIAECTAAVLAGAGAVLGWAAPWVRRHPARAIGLAGLLVVGLTLAGLDWAMVGHWAYHQTGAAAGGLAAAVWDAIPTLLQLAVFALCIGWAGLLVAGYLDIFLDEDRRHSRMTTNSRWWISLSALLTFCLLARLDPPGSTESWGALAGLAVGATVWAAGIEIQRRWINPPRPADAG